MTPETDASELGSMHLPSYGIRRILAAVVADPQLEGARVRLIDMHRADADAYVAAIDEFDPDLIGISIYVWSTPCMVEVARRVKLRRPECMIVFGGPSARTAVFDLPPYSGPMGYLDAVVRAEGEMTFREIARLPDLDRASLEGIPGLELPRPDGWTSTGFRPALTRLDEIDSPFQLDLMPRGSVAYLETFRGCPLGCTFCEWGASIKNPSAVFSSDYLERELVAFRRCQSPAIFVVDAGLNLNSRAFKNLREAMTRLGSFRDIQVWCEIYPTYVREEHLEFLESVGPSYLGIGLQSVDPRVLKDMERPFDLEKFEGAVRTLSTLAHAEVQIIFGLPGDSPAGFRRTLDYALSLPVAVRVYHCLVLPDALLTRGRPEWKLAFDPVTLEMKSCAGWSRDDILQMRAYLTQRVMANHGHAGKFWWNFPPDREPGLGNWRRRTAAEHRPGNRC